jgi:hypothetical protein
VFSRREVRKVINSNDAIEILKIKFDSEVSLIEKQINSFARGNSTYKVHNEQLAAQISYAELNKGALPPTMFHQVLRQLVLKEEVTNIYNQFEEVFNENSKSVQMALDSLWKSQHDNLSIVLRRLWGRFNKREHFPVEEKAATASFAQHTAPSLHDEN